MTRSKVEIEAARKRLARSQAAHKKLELRCAALKKRRAMAETALARARDNLDPCKMSLVHALAGLEKMTGLLDAAISEIERRLYSSKLAVQSDFASLHPAKIQRLAEHGEFAEAI